MHQLASTPTTIKPLPKQTDIVMHCVFCKQSIQNLDLHFAFNPTCLYDYNIRSQNQRNSFTGHHKMFWLPTPRSN